MIIEHSNQTMYHLSTKNVAKAYIGTRGDILKAIVSTTSGFGNESTLPTLRIVNNYVYVKLSRALSKRDILALAEASHKAGEISKVVFDKIKKKLG